MLTGYIDPSVMTYTIQIIAGVGIAIGAFLGIYFRKIKKKVTKKLNIEKLNGKHFFHSIKRQYERALQGVNRAIE